MPNRITGIDTPPAAPAEPDGGPIAVRVEGLHFRYPGSERRALNGVSLDVAAGSFTAVTGPIGAGKTALLQVLLGLYTPQAGLVEIEGRPPHMWDPRERAARVSFVPQEAGLFEGTVRENIGLRSPDSADRIIAMAALSRDVQEFPQGLNTTVGEGGVRVSGGQRQRIALARALAVGVPGLLLLDDPFASVDVDTERAIIEALRLAFGPEAPAAERATIVLCSHRLAAFPQADQVVVLDRGSVVERGSHGELLDLGGLYSRIYTAQHRIEGTR
jgi:ABC-type multidrug transport system fused ATPase/permease subunit